MRKTCIFLVILSFSFLFGCGYHKGVEKDGSYDKTSDNLSSIPAVLSDDKTSDNEFSIPPVLSDDNIALETSSLKKEKMSNIINMVTQNTLTGVGGSYSLQDVNAISPIKQLRKCISTDEVYNVYETEKGRFYVFYGKYRSMPYQVVFYCYSEKKLLFSDFDGIKIEKSTIDDVNKIDEGTAYLDNGLFRPQKVVDDETILYVSVKYENPLPGAAGQ